MVTMNVMDSPVATNNTEDRFGQQNNSKTFKLYLKNEAESVYIAIFINSAIQEIIYRQK